MGPELGGRATPGLPAGGAGMEAEGLEGAQSQNALDDKRYVDEKGMPLPSGTPGPAEFKRMPILMRLVMDQREIARLLVTLADLPLPVEIQQVRINTKMPGIKREPHRQFGYGQEGGDVRGSRRTSIAMPRDQALDETLQYPFDLAVEVAGFIYIFNPPDKSLSVAEGDAEAPAEGEAAAPEAGAAAAEPEAAEPATDSPEKPAASDNERGEGPADAPSDAVTPQDGGNQPGAPAEPEAGAEEKPKPESPPAGFDSGAEPAGAANNENGQPQPE